ncbi:hypothetical protein HMPREF3196_01184 [Bifidobacterium bifidum]|uniref:Uncharacterized protein n=1 Tax=Bifidobacterium bifidum TaxID=1681 RepID=A0A133KNU3_BIFBI|nr:hypothetical protein HMPREF3196_01184 [Bifidobacterium bifidum]
MVSFRCRCRHHLADHPSTCSLLRICGLRHNLRDTLRKRTRTKTTAFRVCFWYLFVAICYI